MLRRRSRLSPVAGSSIGTSRISRLIGSAEAPLEDAEVRLIHVVIVVEVGDVATWIVWNGRTREAGSERNKVLLVHVAVKIKVGAWSTV